MLFRSGMEKALEELCHQAEKAIDEDYNYIVLTDRGVSSEMAAIPSLLAVSAVHNYLIASHKRTKIALIVESAEPREVMHFALLFGYGASAVNPYLAFAVLDDQVKRKEIMLDYYSAEKNYIKSICKGLLKVMSKMGISTLMSYKGAKIFESLGISQELLDKYFGQTISKIDGITMSDIAQEVLTPHVEAFASDAEPEEMLSNLGQYSYRKDSEKHSWNPETISTLQLATRLGSYKKFKEFTSLVDDKKYPMFLRDFMDYKKIGRAHV